MTTIVRNQSVAPAVAKRRLLERIARAALAKALAGLKVGSLTLIDNRGRTVFAGRRPHAGPDVSIRISDSRAYPAIAFGGSLGAGESYMEGWWSSDDLTGVVQLMIANRAALERIDGPWRALAPFAQRIAHRAQRNSRRGSRRNIAAHYDLSNEFFALFLDRTMTYSCAVFENGAETLEQASIEKLDRACRKLDLRSGDHLLEIGTGWGSMAMHAAANYGCRVTTTTISREQAALARRRIRDAGLEDRIDVIERDYRDLEGSYDKIVSIEMIEAVGAERYGEFFAACDRLLRPDGAMLIQAIVIRDRYFKRAAATRDWLKKYIFPGSCLPSVSALLSASAESSDLALFHSEDIGPHYPRTLRTWRERFIDSIEDVRRLGFDDRFVRMWDFYLCYCEGAYLERHVGDVQMLFTGPRCRMSMPAVAATGRAEDRSRMGSA